MRDLVFDKKVNAGLLHQQLSAALGDLFCGCSVEGDHLKVHLRDETPAEVDLQVAALVTAHNNTELTPVQQIEATAHTAGQDLAGQIANRIAWHEANPVVAGNAVEAVRRMQQEWVLFMKYVRRQLLAEQEGP